MARVFCSPSTYVQGSGILKTDLQYFADIGNAGFLITDPFVWNLIGENFTEKLLSIRKITIEKYVISGESSSEEVQRISENMPQQVQFVIALGGGKVIDIAKSVARQHRLKIAVVPTTAATDAPTSKISVLYKEDGTFSHYQMLRRNPELIFVDTEVIVQAPSRFLAAGIADGLATNVEVQAVQQAEEVNMLGGTQTQAALAIAEKCEEILFEQGLQAIEANSHKTVTPAFENVVEANTLLSGIGFESGGLAAAHALHNALASTRKEVQNLLHGEVIAFTTLVQLMLENTAEERLNKYISFYRELGLPTTLADMKLNQLKEEDWLEIADYAANQSDTMVRMPFEVTPEKISTAIIALDDYVLQHFTD